VEDKSELRERIINLFLEEGFEVKKLPQPPQVNINWGLEVITPPPLRIKLHVISIPGKEDRIIVTLPVTISPQHLSEYEKLSPKNKVELYSSMLQKLIQTCPTCQVVIQPGPLELRNIAVSKVVMVEELDPKTVIEVFTLMMNCFNIIISEINRVLPGPLLSQAGKGGEESSTTHL
jgi:hypothetical protein